MTGQPVQDGARSPAERKYDEQLATADHKADKYDRETGAVIETYVRSVAQRRGASQSPVNSTAAVPASPSSSAEGRACAPGAEQLTADHEEKAA